MYVKTEEELFQTLQAVLETYDKFGKKPQKERLAKTMERIGAATFLSEVEKTKNSI